MEQVVIEKRTPEDEESRLMRLLQYSREEATKKSWENQVNKCYVGEFTEEQVDFLLDGSAWVIPQEMSMNCSVPLPLLGCP